MAAPDLVVVGHVTVDRIGDTIQPGGAALYAAVAAHRLGFSVGILTSHADDFPLELIPPQIEVVSVPADATTRFEHDVRRTPRAMRVPSLARPLTAADVPDDWRDAALVLLAPVVNEVDPHVATAFTGSTLAAAAQGWTRALGPDGVVETAVWTPPEFLLGRLQAIFLSTEDVTGQEDAALDWFERVPIGVLTAGRLGALLFVNGERYEVSPRPAREVDPTGAGDVFAAAFLIHYQRTGDAWEAAAAAACAASLSVEASGIASVPDRDTLDEALRAHFRDA
jgi:sugar/nucleoside kinase (ribokinase family)